MNIHTRWQDKANDTKCISWAREFHKATEPFSQGVYVNFISDNNETRVRDAYTPEVYDKLVKVKTKWDPQNLFKMNQNIKPQ